MAIDPSPIQLVGPVNLIQADVTRTDEQWSTTVVDDAPVDAITVWLIGGHKRIDCSHEAAGAEFREHVESIAMRMGADVLRPRGVLQFVFRCPITQTQEHNDTVAERWDIPPGMRFVGTTSRSYKPYGTKVQLRTYFDGEGDSPESVSSLPSLISAIIQKE